MIVSDKVAFYRKNEELNMCGIIGYIGNDALARILDGLELLEYRGYDSAGIAVREKGDGQSVVYKCQGRVNDLRGIIPESDINFSCGIGHTRWATHGGVSDVNAHPHKSGKVTLVHNGIIENYALLKEEYELSEQLVSETDTEVVAHRGSYEILNLQSQSVQREIKDVDFDGDARPFDDRRRQRQVGRLGFEYQGTARYQPYYHYGLRYEFLCGDGGRVHDRRTRWCPC